MNTIGIVILVVVIALAAVAIFLYERKRSQRLRSRFGPEYNRAVEETGSRYRAEAKLEKLEKRVEGFSIHPLRAEDAARFRESWRAIQAKFVDDPHTALGAADRLLGELMSARGYPVSDFEERASEISVNHAQVVEHYRAGHQIALRHDRGQATTEEMRQAMIHYRTLFDDLVGEPATARARAAGSTT
jgi:hypothetical protein